jgi:hypothetical protein
MPVLAEFTAFHAFGIVFAAWAVIVAVLGFTSSRFPGNDNGTRTVVGITLVLMAATIGAAIGTGEKHESEHEAPSEGQGSGTSHNEPPE